MKTGALALACLGFAAGCGPVVLPPVYVDVGRAARDITLYEPAPQPRMVAPAPAQASRLAVPALPAKRLDFSGNKSRLAKVRAAVEESRSRTVREVSRKLREAYQQEIDVIEAKRMGSIDAIRDAALAAAWKDVRTRFTVYANERAPHIIRVALYAGYPDPGPNSGKRLEPDQKARVRQLAVAAQDREALQNLDRDYERDVRLLLAKYDDAVASAITDIRVDIEQMRADAEDRAQRDATAQVAKLTQQIESVLSGRAEVELPAGIASASSTPAGAPVAPAPVVQGMTRAQAEAARLDAVRSLVEIWAAQNGVRIVATPSAVPDRTDEFIAWKRKRSLGP